jgi:hypothetical protein
VDPVVVCGVVYSVVVCGGVESVVVVVGSVIFVLVVVSKSENKIHLKMNDTGNIDY